MQVAGRVRLIRGARAVGVDGDRHDVGIDAQVADGVERRLGVLAQGAEGGAHESTKRTGRIAAVTPFQSYGANSAHSSQYATRVSLSSWPVTMNGRRSGVSHSQRYRRRRVARSGFGMVPPGW